MCVYYCDCSSSSIPAKDHCTICKAVILQKLIHRSVSPSNFSIYYAHRKIYCVCLPNNEHAQPCNFFLCCMQCTHTHTHERKPTNTMNASECIVWLCIFCRASQMQLMHTIYSPWPACLPCSLLSRTHTKFVHLLQFVENSRTQ